MEVLNEWDVVAIVMYFVFVVAVGIFAMFRSNRGTLSGFFLAGRHMTWLPVGASLFASNIGSDHFIGLAGSGAAAGIAVAAFEMNAGVVLQILGWVFLPVYIASKVSTLPEYMSKRFGGQRIRVLLAILSLLLYIFTKVSVNLYSGALFIRQILHWDLYLSIFLLLLLTAVSTITGGLAAVIYTDTLQTVIMICGGLILSVIGFIKVDGISGLMLRYQSAIPNNTLLNSTCGYPLPDAWEMLREPNSEEMPWPGFWFGTTTTSIWYWCADQMMVQRALASKSLSHAQGGTLFVGYLKFLPLFLIVFPGMISRALFPDIVACVVPEECEAYCGSRVGCSNLAYPILVLKLLPPGLKGILIAVMLAALMSDLTSVFNSASTLITMDIWQRIRKAPSTTELLIVGKLFSVVMVGVSIAWVPIILEMQGGQLFHYIQAVSAYLSPPIAAVYLLAVFWKRLNELGAFYALIGGFVLGIIRMFLEFYYQSPACGEVDNRPKILSEVHYMYFAIILFWLTVIVAVVISLLTTPLEKFRVIRTLYWTRFDKTVRPDEETVKNDKQVQVYHIAETSLHENDSKDSKELNGINYEFNSSIGTINTIGKSVDELISTSGDTPTNLPKWKKFIFWLCGYNDGKEQLENSEAMQTHLDKLSSLKQRSSVKIFLFINVILIVLITIVLNVFFTVGTKYLLKKRLAES